MKQYYSQWGEDKIIEEIFSKIGYTNRIAIDIGAWDGKHLSNTLLFAEQHGFHRILCEADEQRAIEATKNYPDSNVFGRVENIDSILSVCKCPVDIDLMSIDVDGDEYYLWQDMVKYRPRVVVIEYNQTVPPHIDIKQERGGSFGASYQALCRLGLLEKRYCLLHTTITNMIFVDLDLSDPFNKGWDFNRAKPNTIWLQYIITGYNGKQYLVGEPAHNDNQGGVHEALISDVKVKPAEVIWEEPLHLTIERKLKKWMNK